MTRGDSLLAVGRRYHLPEGFDSGSPVSLIVSFLMFQSLIRRNAARDMRKAGLIRGPDDDLLIDGSTRYDGDPAALNANLVE